MSLHMSSRHSRAYFPDYYIEHRGDYTASDFQRLVRVRPELFEPWHGGVSIMPNDVFKIGVSKAGTGTEKYLADTTQSDDSDYNLISLRNAAALGFVAQKPTASNPPGNLGYITLTWSIYNQPKTYRNCQFYVFDECPGKHDAVLARTAEVPDQSSDEPAESYPVRNLKMSAKEKENAKKNKERQNEEIKQANAKHRKDYEGRKDDDKGGPGKTTPKTKSSSAARHADVGSGR